MANLPVPTLATEVPGDYSTAALYNALSTSGLFFSLNVPAAVLYQATGQSVTSGGAPAAITLDSESLDTYGGHSTTTNTSRYVGQVPGYYLVLGTAGIAANATGNRLVQLEKNGTLIAGAITVGPAPGTANASVQTAAAITFLNGSTDYVETYVYQTSGSTLTTQNAGMLVVWIHS